MTIRDWKGAPSGIAPLPDIDKPRNFRFVQHSHIAKRAGPHKDVRLLDPLSNTTFNWAVKRIPKPGQISLAHPTGFHPTQYLDFQGILKGYGAGKVSIERSETAEVLESQPDKLKFTLFKGRVPEQFAIRHQGGRWMLQNITPSRDVKVWDKLLPKTRPKYKEKRVESLDLSDKDEILQAKIDGANTHVVLRGGQIPRVFSSRESKTSPTKLLEHTFKIRDLMSKKVPEELRDTVLQAELYGTDERGKAVPARLLAGLLNASTPKSREMQQRARQELRLMPFKVLRYKGKETKNLTYDENMKILKDLKKKMPFLQLPVAAETSAEKAELLKRIRIGKESLTLEGVVAHHRIRPEMTKVKFKPDFDVKIDGVFPSKKPGYAGGFLYKVNGKESRIGTGFSDKMKKMMAEHPERFKGMTAKVEAQEAFPSGKLRAPAFKEFHLNKNEPERLEKIAISPAGLEKAVARISAKTGIIPQITRSGSSFSECFGKGRDATIRVVVKKEPKPLIDVTKMHELTEASFQKRPRKRISFSTHAHPAIPIQDWNILQTMRPSKAPIKKVRKEELESMSTHIGLSKKETQKLLNLPRLSPAAKKRLIVGGMKAGQRTSGVLDKLRATSPSHKEFHDLVEEVTFDTLTKSPKLLNWVEKSLGKLPV